MRRLALLAAITGLAGMAFVSFIHPSVARRPPPAALPVAAPAPALPPKALHFRHTILNTSGDTPEMCLRFSEKLDQRAEAHYAADHSTQETLRLQ